MTIHTPRAMATVTTTAELQRRLEARLAGLGSAVVAFSGGVDSSLVAALAARSLGERALAVTAVSPALATGELDGRVGGRPRGRHRARDDHDGRARARRLPGQRPRPLLPLQVRAVRRARRRRRGARLRGGAVGRERRRHGRLAARPGGGARSTASCTRCSRPARRRPTCARWPVRWACRAPTRWRARAWPRASPTARRSTRTRSGGSTRPSRRCAPSATACCACATTATSASWSSPPTSSTARSQPEQREAIADAIRGAGYAHAAIDLEPFRSGSLNRLPRGRLTVLQRPAS